MNAQEQAQQYIDGLAEPKRSDMAALHRQIPGWLPGTRLWFDDGRDSDNKTVSNPTIGYGQYTIKYANGKTKDFFQVGLSANTTGISVYILGIGDKTYLSRVYGKELGKAKVTGYCIKFKSLKDINTAVLESAIRDGVMQSSAA